MLRGATAGGGRVSSSSEDSRKRLRTRGLRAAPAGGIDAPPRVRAPTLRPVVSDPLFTAAGVLAAAVREAEEPCDPATEPWGPFVALPRAVPEEAPAEAFFVAEARGAGPLLGLLRPVAVTVGVGPATGWTIEISSDNCVSLGVAIAPPSAAGGGREDTGLGRSAGGGGISMGVTAAALDEGGIRAGDGVLGPAACPTPVVR